MELWAHQKKAIAEALDRNYYGLFMEAGTGKTFTTLEILRGKYTKHGMILPTVIFCPSVVIPNWRSEILKFTKIKSERIFLLQGPGKKRIEIVNSAPANSIFITNFEALAVMPDLIKTLQNNG